MNFQEYFSKDRRSINIDIQWVHSVYVEYCNLVLFTNNNGNNLKKIIDQHNAQFKQIEEVLSAQQLVQFAQQNKKEGTSMIKDVNKCVDGNDGTHESNSV